MCVCVGGGMALGLLVANEEPIGLLYFVVL